MKRIQIPVVEGSPSMTIMLVSDRDLSWSFRDSRPSLHGPAFSAVLDPFPAYAHDAEQVQATLEVVASAWRPETPITYWLLNQEETARTNAFAVFEQARRDDLWRGIHGHIVVAGKRIPPHPAVTRYLVAHEYGHLVQRWLADRESGKEDDVLRAYRAARRFRLRGQHAGGGTWHRALEEVFACDFRILVAGIEPEYWPHPGIPRPEFGVPGVGLRRWWREQGVAKLAGRR
jgi:hypothetical protein